MKTTTNTKVSSFGREVTFRCPRHVATVLNAHMRQDAGNEQIAFGLATRAKTAEGTLIVVNELILPDQADLMEQSSVGICPTREFQAYLYLRAFQSQKTIVEFHSHPGNEVPDFSGTDDHYSQQNAEYIRSKLPEPVTLALIVGNNRFDAFNAMIYDRQLRNFRPADRLEILGKPSELLVFGESRDQRAGENDRVYDRQRLIPGWNQLGLERQRIAIIGAGGNGAPLFQTLVSLGAGRQGWVSIVDPDLVEENNLPRLPYACAEQIGTPKVSVAAQYAGRKSPSTPVYPYPCSFAEQSVQARVKAATVLFGCGDNDGLRKEANELAVRFGISYIDLGCDVQTEGGTVVAGGQVRTVLPGENACLVCCQGFDPSQAALDQMEDVGRARRAAQGYVQNSTTLATPSVANLNALTAQFAVAQFLALVNGAQFARWDYLHFEQFTGRTIPACSKNRPDCPVCGNEGCLGAGDPVVRPETKRYRLKKLVWKA